MSYSVCLNATSSEAWLANMNSCQEQTKLWDHKNMSPWRKMHVLVLMYIDNNHYHYKYFKCFKMVIFMNYFMVQKSSYVPSNLHALNYIGKNIVLFLKYLSKLLPYSVLDCEQTNRKKRVCTYLKLSQELAMLKELLSVQYRLIIQMDP